MLKTDVLGRFMIEVFLNQRLLMRCSVCKPSLGPRATTAVGPCGQS